MQVLLKLDGPLNSLGPNFNLTANVGSVSPSPVTGNELLAGIPINVDPNATTVTITSIGTCTNSITLQIILPTTTSTTSTSSTSTSTTTQQPTTTSTSSTSTSTTTRQPTTTTSSSTSTSTSSTSTSSTTSSTTTVAPTTTSTSFTTSTSTSTSTSTTSSTSTSTSTSTTSTSSTSTTTLSPITTSTSSTSTSTTTTCNPVTADIRMEYNGNTEEIIIQLFDPLVGPVNAPTSFTINFAGFRLYDSLQNCEDLLSSCFVSNIGPVIFPAGQSQITISSGSGTCPCLSYPYTRRDSLTINGNNIINGSTFNINSCFTLTSNNPIDCTPTICFTPPGP